MRTSPPPPQDKQQKQGVVIWHVGRCGSSVLGQCMNQHPDIQWENEIFNKWMPRKRGNQPIPCVHDIISNVKGKQSLPFQIIEVKFLQAQHPGIFKISAIEMSNILEEHGYNKFVLLERKNILRRMISHCVAIQSGLYHLQASSPLPTPKPCRIDLSAIRVGTETKSMMGWLLYIDEAYTLFKNSLSETNTFLSLSYEEHIKTDPCIALRKVCQYLKIKEAPAEVRLRRTNPFSIKSLIANYHELDSHIKGSRYEWMLEDL